MNTALLTRVDEQHQPHPPSPRRVALADRVALHLGLALITWSRRPQSAPVVREYNPHAHRERQRVLRQREEQWRLAACMSHPWR